MAVDIPPAFGATGIRLLADGSGVVLPGRLVAQFSDEFILSTLPEDASLAPRTFIALSPKGAGWLVVTDRVTVAESPFDAPINASVRVDTTGGDVVIQLPAIVAANRGARIGIVFDPIGVGGGVTFVASAGQTINGFAVPVGIDGTTDLSVTIVSDGGVDAEGNPSGPGNWYTETFSRL